MQNFEREDLGLIIEDIKGRQDVFLRQVVIEAEDELIILQRGCRCRNKLIAGSIRQRHVLGNVVSNDGVNWYFIIWIRVSVSRIDELRIRQQFAEIASTFGRTQSLKRRCDLALAPTCALI